MMFMYRQITLMITAVLSLSGCLGMPERVRPVQQFEADRYLGTWYEIARLDHSFERGLTRISASYSKREDGGIRVVNRGYDPERGRWKTATGKAYFVNSPGEGHLKVSFFGPFYGSYVVRGSACRRTLWPVDLGSYPVSPEYADAYRGNDRT
jgi:apolipoprotein D and lipocalin family protein